MNKVFDQAGQLENWYSGTVRVDPTTKQARIAPDNIPITRPLVQDKQVGFERRGHEIHRVDLLPVNRRVPDDGTAVLIYFHREDEDCSWGICPSLAT